MSIRVKIKDIVDEMEMLFEESRTFFNTETGEIITVTDEDLRAAEDEDSFDHLPDWHQDAINIAIDVVESFENYIELPTKYDINEYEIMEDFCFTISNQKKHDILLKSLKGKGAFRRFKDNIGNLNIEDQWYTFREEKFKQIAIDWCRDHKIHFIE